MKRVICIILVAGSFALHAQNKADSLIGVLNVHDLTANEQLKLYQEIYYALIGNNLQNALMYTKKGLALAEKENNREYMATFHVSVGFSYMSLGQPDTARYNFNRALDIAEKLGSRKLQATALLQLGNLYSDEDNMKTALECKLKALSICDTSDTDGLYAKILLGVGGTYRILANSSLAIHYLERAKKAMANSSDLKLLGAVYYQLADIYSGEGKFDTALEYGLKAMEIARRDDYKGLVGVVAGSLALIYQAGFNDDDKALEYAREAVRQAEELGDPRLVKAALNTLASIYCTQKRWKECEETSLRILQAPDTSFWEITNNTFRNLVVANIYLNKKDRAANFFNQYDSLLRVHTEQGYQETMMNMEVKYKTEKKDLEHRMLQQAHDRQSTMLLILAVALVLIISLSAMLVVFYRKSVVNNRDLKGLHHIKDRLLSVIAHDLRSPVSALISLLELMKTSHFDPSMRTAMINDISNRVNGMYGMIDNLLRWAKSQMQGITPHPKTFDAQIESRSVTDVLEDIAGKKGIALQNLIAQQQVYADRDMFAVTVQNITMNAIKYTSAGGAVTLSSELSGKMLVISVKDTGIGMTLEVQKKLFDLAATQSRRGTANEMGTGLGLSLCADFVKANGGSIWFKSAPSEGSTFFFNVPVAGQVNG